MIIVPYAMVQWGLHKHSLSSSGARAGMNTLCAHLAHLMLQLQFAVQTAESIFDWVFAGLP